MEELQVILEKAKELSCSDFVTKVFECILKSKGKTDSSHKMTSSELIKEYIDLRKNHPDEIPNLAETTLQVYLSRASVENDTHIYKLSQQKGYFYSSVLETGTTKESRNSDEKKEKLLEVDLYPTFLTWLSFSNTRVCDIHTIKSLQQWGNPDLVGIKLYDIMGRAEFDITTIEVKRNITDWRKLIFESVSHTRMVNRSYYAFVCTQIEFDKNRLDMMQYAQQFHVGLLVLIKGATQKSWMNPSKIIEVLPAPILSPIKSNVQNFLYAVGIKKMEDFCTFGKAATDLYTK